ncbi:MAG: type IV pilus twitching motility protein PilT [Deltaproteobacteria bacterium]|nr:type IV pilus twitching motility protein PilT [Deltaproteobacteria bacterium]
MPVIRDLLNEMVARGASDLHITTGSPPIIRVRSELLPLDGNPLSPQETREMCYSVLSEAQKHKLEESFELDLSFGVRGLGRFRANIYMQRGTLAGAFRLIPHEIPSLEKLGLPRVVDELCTRSKGLILVTGPTGSGKSTTLAAMIDRINTIRHEHVVTIEDPIEFLHRHKSCLVNQREVHQDTKSFHAALRSVLRQDPDVVLIGEMRDLETMEAALTVAETGHLTLATLHTNSCVETIGRIIDAFPAHQQSQVRVQLSFVLQAVLCQTLIPTLDGQTRTMALEIMIPNAAIRNLIRDDKTHQLYSQMQTGQKESGMRTLNQSLLALCKKGLISWEAALTRSFPVEEFRQMMAGSTGR